MASTTLGGESALHCGAPAPDTAAHPDVPDGGSYLEECLASPPAAETPAPRSIGVYGEALEEAIDLLDGAADALSGLILLLRAADESPKPKQLCALLEPVFMSLDAGIDDLRPFLADHAALIQAAVLRAKDALQPKVAP